MVITSVLSAYCDEGGKFRYVNAYEVYQDKYEHNHRNAIQKGCRFEHEDIVDVTERYCNQHTLRLLRESSHYSEKVMLVSGPRQFLLDRVHADLRVGNGYELEVVIYDTTKNGNGVVGRIDLRPYVTIKDIYTGSAILVFENDERLPLHWMEIGENQDLYLRIVGAIKILSDVNYIIQVQNGQE